MEAVSDRRNTLQYCGDFKSPLVYTPSGFQDPFQLLYLKETWFHHQHSSYSLHSRLLERQSEVDHLASHSAVIGFIEASNSFDNPQQKSWHIQLLSSVLGFSTNTLPSCLPQQCHIEDVNFMDKLDLIECINFPLAQLRSELETTLKEDIHTIEQRTRTFELEFDSFLWKLHPAASQFEAVLSSLFSLSPSGGVSINEVAQALRQHIHWLDSDLLAAFVSICGATAIPLSDSNKEAMMVSLQREGERPPCVLICARVVRPMSVLHWYEHAVAENAVKGSRIDASSKFNSKDGSPHNAHHWTPNCYRQCDW
jgi:hypothetical protein